jgi:hypothetical protein
MRTRTERRTSAPIRLAAVVAGLAAALGLGAAAPATAAPATAESAAAASAGASIAGGVNQQVGDVLGRGYDQIVRFNGTKVEIAEPASRGGAVLSSFEAGARTSWTVGVSNPFADFYGRGDLIGVVGQQPSRLAVVGDAIYVSNLRISGNKIFGEWIEPEAQMPSHVGSIVRKYSADGRKLAEREFAGKHAVTALDAYEYQGSEYLAIGLNTDGVRIAHGADLTDFRELHTDWNGRGEVVWERDQVTAVKLVEDAGRLLLVAAKLTYEHPAIVTTDLRADVEGLHAGIMIWTYNDRGLFDAWHWADQLEFGAFGPNGETMIGIATPANSRVEFLYVANGKLWTLNDGGSPLTAIRSFNDLGGVTRVAIRRADGVTWLDAAGQWHPVEASAEHELEWLGSRRVPLTVTNQTGYEVEVAVIPDGARCWLAPSGAHTDSPAPVPGQPATVASGTESVPYVTARRMQTADCTPGSWRRLELSVTRPDTGVIEHVSLDGIVGPDGIDRVKTPLGAPYWFKASTEVDGDAVKLILQAR